MEAANAVAPPGRGPDRRIVAAVVMAVLALVGFVPIPSLWYFVLFVASCAAVGVLIGGRQRLAADAFIESLAPSWIGYSVGFLIGLVAYLLIILAPDFVVNQDLPLVLVSQFGVLLAGVPTGFLTGLFAAMVAAVRDWVLNRTGHKKRADAALSRVDDPTDPFGWKQLGRRK